jgi:hypothetical protein
VAFYSTPTITISGGGTFCYGQSPILRVSVSGATINQYQWYNQSGSISGAASSAYSAPTAGTYYCVCRTSNGCTFNSPSTSVSFDFTVEPLLSNITACANQQIQLPIVASCQVSTYVWYNAAWGTDPIVSDNMFFTIASDGTLIIPGYVTGGMFVGDYYCEVTDYLGHTVTTNACHISDASGCP